MTVEKRSSPPSRRSSTPLSSEFVGIEGAINLFLKAFPAGFDDPFYAHDEREYKDKAAAFIVEQLSERRIGEAVERSEFQAVAKDVRRAFSKTNLVSPFELMAFGGSPQASRQPGASLEFATIAPVR